MTYNTTRKRTELAAPVASSLRDFLKGQLANLPIGKIEILEGMDHAGEPILEIIIPHGFTNKPLDSALLFRIDGMARDLAWQMGERRFLHFRHLYNKKQEVAA
jgi:hypothetical protein